MSNSGKLYRMNADVYASKLGEIAKLPQQQRIILQVMKNHCVAVPMRGSDVISIAVREYGLETRQKYTVLYAWYARSNEKFGVYLDRGQTETVTEAEQTNTHVE